MAVNFEEVNKNIKKDNLDTRLIRIVYEELTEFEAREILEYQGGENLGKGRVLSYYSQDMDPLYQKNKCHHTLKGVVCDRHLFLGCSGIKILKL